MKELTSIDLSDAGAAFLQSLSDFSNLVLSGGVPEDFRPFFFGANLFAFSKLKGGIRPIAVGNTLRRLVAKCAQRKTEIAGKTGSEIWRNATWTWDTERLRSFKKVY